MDISLQHMSCSKIVASIFNKLLPFMDVFEKGEHPVPRESRCMNYKEITRRIMEDIKEFVPYASLQKLLQNFISPIFCEIEEWAKTCYYSWSKDADTFFIIMNYIPQCWLTDGTIDREKLVQLAVKNNNILLINRFMFASTNCLFEDILNLWELLSETEKSHLRNNSDFVVEQWIIWLESESNKDWQSCVAWIFGTPLWNTNMYVLKHVLSALTPAERSFYLLKTLIGREVSSDVMRFGLWLLNRDERILIFRASTVEVYKCIASWPVRSCFFQIADVLWPYLTVDTFCSIIHMLLLQLKKLKRDYFELVEILNKFWDESPCHFQNIAKVDDRFSEPLHYVLGYEFSRVFSKWMFLSCFTDTRQHIEFLSFKRKMAAAFDD